MARTCTLAIAQMTDLCQVVEAGKDFVQRLHQDMRRHRGRERSEALDVCKEDAVCVCVCRRMMTVTSAYRSINLYVLQYESTPRIISSLFLQLATKGGLSVWLLSTQVHAHLTLSNLLMYSFLKWSVLEMRAWLCRSLWTEWATSRGKMESRSCSCGGGGRGRHAN